MDPLYHCWTPKNNAVYNKCTFTPLKLNLTLFLTLTLILTLTLLTLLSTNPTKPYYLTVSIGTGKRDLA